jgi:hypothetical protein
MTGEHHIKIEYLFQPEQVSEIIDELACIKEKIGNPSKEGTTSSSFPSARKTSREIYRILCNQHYSHLQELLKDLEYCLDKGWQQPKILQTRSGKELHSAISELSVAAHFAKTGFEISSFDEKKGQESVPDLMVVNSNLSCICEVYSPRDWDGIGYYKDDLRLSLLHLDIPWDFSFRITFTLARHFNERQHLIHFDPWQFSDYYIDSSHRSDQLTPAISEIAIAIQNSNSCIVNKKLVDETNNTITEISIHEIEPSQYKLPARDGVIIGPSLTGYSPEGMFDRLVQRRLQSKSRKAQTDSVDGADLRALFVDISHLGYNSEFGHPYYQKKFAESLKKHFEHDFSGVDVVIFFQPNRSDQQGIRVFLLFKKHSVATNKIESLLGVDWESGQLDGTMVDQDNI